jgi:hypothetical protein
LKKVTSPLKNGKNGAKFFGKNHMHESPGWYVAYLKAGDPSRLGGFLKFENWRSGEYKWYTVFSLM